MKHLKKYKIFEAEIKRTFDEWLKNPKASKKDSFDYQFEFPVKKVFNIDESNLDIDNIADYLKKERGCNLYRDIANEIDLSSGLDEDEEIPTISEEEVKSNIDQYFDTWLAQEYNNDMAKFFRMYDLDFEEDHLSEENFEDLKDNFNESHLENYYTYREYNHDFKILSLEVTKLKNGNKIVGEIKIDRELTDDEMESVEDYLVGQCSDGWGEGFEQSQEKEKIKGLNFYVSIKPWWSDGYPEWYLNFNQK